MRRIRRFEERSLDLREQGLIHGSMHLCCGQEAIAVGACRCLEPRDALTATYRGHGWAIARGIPLADLFAELMGRDSALCGGRGGSAYFSSAAHGFLGENSIVGAGVPIALGAALAADRDGDGAVSLVSIGDGALSQGAVHEALNFAAVWQLPLVVIVENNVYSEMTPVRDMVRVDPLSLRAAAYGMPGVTVEGRDVTTVSQAVAESVSRARSGGGPSLVEALCDRLVGHYTGDIQQYRTAEELEEAHRIEPLTRIRDANPELSDELDAADAAIESEIDAAIATASATAEPDASGARDHLYA
jgi:TPP-dependent pyruvate/acetoin dehydrogenase alpha subunit